MCGLCIRPGQPEERQYLEDLQRRASLVHEVHREALLAHPEAITLPAEQIERGEVLVAEIDKRIAGFAVVLDDHGKAELDGLFVEPDLWRNGVGLALIEAAAAEARRRGLGPLKVIANPTAEEFYIKSGFVMEGMADTQFGPGIRMTR
ncbi:MAG: GNAT family N-acetyltransferase [Sphingomicrobium sp.]